MTAIRFLVVLAWRTDRRRLLIATALMFTGLLATPLAGLLLQRFTDAAFGSGTGIALLATGLAILLVAELMLGHFAHLYHFELGELLEARIDAELGNRAHGGDGIAHFDDPSYADTLALVRQEATRTRPALEAALQLTGIVLQTAVTTAILASVSPWLAALPLAALPPVLLARVAQSRVDDARQRHAGGLRTSMHLLELATNPAAIGEIRLADAGGYLRSVHEKRWAATTSALVAAQLQAAGLRAAGQLLFATAYGAGLWLVVRQALAGHATAGQVVLVVTLAVQVSVQVAGALGLLSALHAASRMVRRLDELRVAPGRDGDRPAPQRLCTGITLTGVTFAYPGAAGAVLDDVTVTLPAGAAIALVGENGTGKSTLVKLLCGLYEPGSGTIHVDGTDLREINPQQWRHRIAMLFQDYARFELLLRENVGTGRLPAMDDDAALTEAAREAGAEAVAARVGWDGLLGHGYDDGTGLSGGQWQRLGLARSLMRRRPLLLVLDEPAAALDAHAEHELFARFAERARTSAGTDGAITVFVSHRLSTVRTADLIIVMAGSRVTELGTHDELMARDGRYAAMFRLQARAYAG